LPEHCRTKNETSKNLADHAGLAETRKEKAAEMRRSEEREQQQRKGTEIGIRHKPSLCSQLNMTGRSDRAISGQRQTDVIISG
jgi:hypothetical protein